MSDIDIHRSRDEAEEQVVNSTSGGCACGEHDEDLPELDVQTIPHAVRHASIFGAIDSLRPGAGLIISATHNPVPLLMQMEARYGEGVGAEYLDEGPERWRILIRRAAA